MADPNRPADSKPSRKNNKASAYENAPYERGKGKPPVEHQFKPGGPPGPGRPRGSRNQSDLDKLLDHKIVTGEDSLGRPIRKTLRRVINMRLMKAAADGDLRAVKMVKDYELKHGAINGSRGTPLLSGEELAKNAEHAERAKKQNDIVRNMMIIYLDETAGERHDGADVDAEALNKRRIPAALKIYDLVGKLLEQMQTDSNARRSK